jgi:hypothetical protein
MYILCCVFYYTSMVFTLYINVYISYVRTYVYIVNLYLVPSLGFLFEYYMHCCSGYAINRKWCADVYTINVDGVNVMPDDRQEYYKNACLSQYCGWLLNHILCIGSNGRRQMFYLTFVLHYFGLSRDGIDILSKYGYSVTLDMFDTLRDMYKLGSVDTSRYYNIYLKYLIVLLLIQILIANHCSDNTRVVMEFDFLMYMYTAM